MKIIIGLLFLLLACTACAQTKKESVSEKAPGKEDDSFSLQTGADQIGEVLRLIQGKRTALIVNQTSVTGAGQTHLLDTLLSSGADIRKVFTPEHGFRGEADAGETVSNEVDRRTRVPLVSLYGTHKKPAARQLEDIDAVIFDIQDVGARFYTYISTLTYAMEACAENGKEIIVLDRPNPCDYVNGPVLKEAYKSFVGMLPVPVLHGCTVGELARMIRGERWIQAADSLRLTVIPLKNWKHGQPYSLPVKPSPNLPNDLSIALYPSLCPFEGTVISVGRGTTFPFQVIGGTDPGYGTFTFIPRSLPGWDKNPLYQNRTCYGTDLRKLPFPQGFTLEYIIEYYRKSGKGTSFFSRPEMFDLLMGTDQVRKSILQGMDARQIEKSWQKELDEYRTKIRSKYLLYDTE